MGIESIAIEYIKARQDREKARINRRNQIVKCVNDRGSIFCVYDENLNKSEWCDSCKKTAEYHEEYHRLADKVGALLRKLTKEVLK